jgi:hypothetical protein
MRVAARPGDHDRADRGPEVATGRVAARGPRPQGRTDGRTERRALAPDRELLRRRAGTQSGGLDERQAFSGVGSFVDPRFTWDHDIDTRQQQLLSSDTALLERRSTFLLERGEDYVERWRREAEPDRVAVLEWSGEACAPTEGPAPLARIVVVGRLAVGVWRHPSPAATSLVRASTGWSTTATFGRLGPDRELVEVMLDRMDRGHDLVGGWICK